MPLLEPTPDDAKTLYVRVIATGGKIWFWSSDFTAILRMDYAPTPGAELCPYQIWVLGVFVGYARNRREAIARAERMLGVRIFEDLNREDAEGEEPLRFGFDKTC